MRSTKRKRTVFENVIVTLWGIIVFCGVGVIALELPALLSEIFRIDLNTFTVKVLILIGCVALFFKYKDIKDREKSEEIFDQVQNTLKQHEDTP